MNQTISALSQQRIERYHYLSDDVILQKFIQFFQTSFGDSLDLVMLYGSALRNADYADGLLDFYIVLKHYSDTRFGRLERIANIVLPPNVYYLRFEHDGIVYQAKYATILTQQLINKVGQTTFHPYFWARFCQPMAVLYSRSDSSYLQAVKIQEMSVRTFLSASLATVNETVQLPNLWVEGFQLTYATELRAESRDRASVVYQYDAQNYDRFQVAFMQDEQTQPLLHKKKSPIRARLIWKLRNLWGKLVSIVRLVKAVFTFAHGVEYIIWKIERHNDTHIEVSQKVKDHPLLFAWPLLYRLWRSGMIR